VLSACNCVAGVAVIFLHPCPRAVRALVIVLYRGQGSWRRRSTRRGFRLKSPQRIGNMCPRRTSNSYVVASAARSCIGREQRLLQPIAQVPPASDTPPFKIISILTTSCDFAACDFRRNCAALGIERPAEWMQSGIQHRFPATSNHPTVACRRTISEECSVPKASMHGLCLRSRFILSPIAKQSRQRSRSHPCDLVASPSFQHELRNPSMRGRGWLF